MFKLSSEGPCKCLRQWNRHWWSRFWHITRSGLPPNFHFKIPLLLTFFQETQTKNGTVQKPGSRFSLNRIHASLALERVGGWKQPVFWQCCLAMYLVNIVVTNNTENHNVLCLCSLIKVVMQKISVFYSYATRILRWVPGPFPKCLKVCFVHVY